jgi:Flp pilus assembly pilin Flp
MKPINNLCSGESGLELSEYAIAAALLALAVILVFTSLGNSITGTLNALANLLNV